jgi:hypothetical protein
VAVIFLARRNSAWGFGAGVAIAEFWNDLQLFVTNETLLVFIVGIGHLVLMVGCMAAFRRLRGGREDWWQFLARGLPALGYLGVIVATLLLR